MPIDLTKDLVPQIVSKAFFLNLISLRNLVTANPSPQYYGQSEKFRDGSQMFNSGYMDSDPGASIGYGKKRT